MSQVSRRFLKPEISSRLHDLLLETVVACSSKIETAEFLDDLLSPTEKIMLAKRLAIAYLLSKKLPYRTIAQTLKVSISTIGNIALMLKIQGKGFRKAVDKIMKNEKWKLFYQELGDTVIKLIGKGKGGNWRATNSILHQRKQDRNSPI